ncbi:MAG: GMC family oxidoreductase [Leptospirales bacterium]|nr:GMC family oxidoreductase [Leptospirales bacterium]
MAEQNYDVIIIGTGAGGGTLAHKLATQAPHLKILILERGDWLPREQENWDTISVFQKERYHTTETWLDSEGKEFHPGTGYWVGGNTKVYGAALLRLRERDFEEVRHAGGISPAWPVRYSELEPYYREAEILYRVHGKQGDDPTEPPRSSDFPFPAVSHEPRIAEMRDELQRRGLKPFHVPLGVHLNEANPLESECIRCGTCDGFPCLVNAKSDSDISCIRPVHTLPNVDLIVRAKVQRLVTGASGRSVEEVQAEVDGQMRSFKGGIVVAACGAINSAALLLRSHSDRHPQGLANGSGQVGRNFMKHVNGAILGISDRRNPTVFQKTMAINDFYWGEPDFEFPMGHIQLLGKANKDMLRGDAPKFAPGRVLEEMATHSIDWWLTSEDLPDANNRVRINQDKVILDYHDNNTQGYDRLMARWTKLLREVEKTDHIVPHSLYLRKKIPLAGVAHQVGTARMGKDAASSVLDANCKAHELDNLYVVDGAFFPSSGAVNPSLTIMAMALRVAEHLQQRIKGG